MDRGTLNLFEDCFFVSVSSKINLNIRDFSCGNADLDDFFRNDTVNFAKELMGKTYCYVLNENPKEIVCAVTLANDSLKMKDVSSSTKNRLQRKIPNQKRMRSYPAVLIGRIGVNIKYQHLGIGKQLMDFIKMWFIDEENKTGCRFIVVDAYNNEQTLNYYLSNDFRFLYQDEQDEKDVYNVPCQEKLHTRLMVYDLIKEVERL